MTAEIIKKVMETLLVDGLKEILKFFKKHFKENDVQLVDACKQTLEIHFSEVVNWSNRLEFIRLAKAKSIQTDTIPLILTLKLRKFQKVTDKEVSFSELICSRENYLILGDPGAGKTTTVKQIINSFLFKDFTSPFRIPILVRLKEIEKGTLYSKIADLIGLPYNTSKEEVKGVQRTKIFGSNEVIENEIILEVLYKQHVGDLLLENAIPIFLNSINAFVILDGYDEINNRKREIIKKNIIELSRKAEAYKIILTSRHGESFSNLEGFSYCQLEELNTNQIIALSNLWADNPEAFLEVIFHKSYKELTNRPLFLNFLIIHFNLLGYLPTSSKEAIRQILHLLLNDWNEFQGVNRTSKYSNFYTPEKYSFLSHISFLISFEENNKSFSHSQLITIYKKIHGEYNLELSEINEVINEIESHTGIIIQLADDNYEFSHLILQEYLAADFIVKQPFSEKIYSFINSYPAIIALTTCISTNPSLYFANLFLNPAFNINKINERRLIIFIQRINIEKIALKRSAEFGVAIMHLYDQFHFNKEIIKELDNLSGLKNFLESLVEAKRWYYISDSNNNDNLIIFSRNAYSNPLDYTEFNFPQKVALSAELNMRLHNFNP